jgi:hypothetical protein
MLATPGVASKVLAGFLTKVASGLLATGKRLISGMTIGFLDNMATKSGVLKEQLPRLG